MFEVLTIVCLCLLFWLLCLIYGVLDRIRKQAKCIAWNTLESTELMRDELIAIDDVREVRH